MPTSGSLAYAPKSAGKQVFSPLILVEENVKLVSSDRSNLLFT